MSSERGRRMGLANGGDGLTSEHKAELLSQAAFEEAGAARHAAEAAAARSEAILTRLDDIKGAQLVAAAAMIDVRNDLVRIEGHVERTNGRVTLLELWRAEMRGISQGVGGTGRLFLYMLGAASSAGGLIVVALKLLERP